MYLPFLQNCEIADTIVRYNVAASISANISVRLMKTRSKYDGDIVMAIIKTRVYKRGQGNEQGGTTS